jgi:hypothetical protein
VLALLCYNIALLVGATRHRGCRDQPTSAQTGEGSQQVADKGRELLTGAHEPAFS